MCARPRLIRSALALILIAAYAGPVAASYTIEYNGSAHIKQIPVVTSEQDERKFKHTFTNTGSQAETYRMVIHCEYVNVDPAQYQHSWSMCNTNICALPDWEDTITLVPAQSDTVTLKVLSSVDYGSSTATLTFEGLTTGTIQTFTYSVIGDRCEVIVVDDSPGNAYGAQLASGLDLAGAAYGMFDTEIETLGNASIDFSLANTIIYTSGDRSGSILTMPDTDALAGFLDGGGTLLMSGQELFDDLSGSAFATTYLGAIGLDETSETSVVGVTGDSIGDGLALTLGGGAGNQVSQNRLGGGTVFLRYGDGTGAAVRNNTAGYNAYSFGFGLEALSDTDLSSLMGAIASGAVPVEEMSWSAVKERFGQ